MKFGHRLKILRISRNIEPIEIAERLSISESTYRRYERDESEPSLSVLYRIAAVFEIKITELLEEELFVTLPKISEQK